MARSISIRLAVEDADRVKAILQSVGQEGDNLASAFERGASRGAQSFERLQRTLDTTYGAEQRLAGVQEQLNRAVEQGLTSQARANELLQLAQTRYTALATASTAAAATAGNSFRSIGQVAGQAGFQLQDFVVQVGAGQNALVALGQQGSQFLGMFGAGGAIAGAGLAILAMGANFLTAGQNAEEMRKQTEAAFKGMKESAESAREVIRDIEDLFRNAAQRAREAARARIEELRETARRDLEIATLRSDDAGIEASRLQTDIARLERQRQAIVDNLERQRRASNGQMLLPTDATQQIDSQLWTARAALQGTQALMSRMTERMDQLRGAVERLSTITPEQVVANRESGRGSSGPTQAERDAQSLQGAWDRWWENAEKKAEDRATREADQRERRSTQETEREEKRRQESFDRTVERYSSDLAKGTVDALFDGAKKGETIFSTLAKTFERGLRTALASALDVMVFRPAISSLLSGFGFVGNSSGGGISLSGIGNLFGGGSASGGGAAGGAGGEGGGGIGGVFNQLGNVLGVGRNLWSGGWNGSGLDLGSMGIFQGNAIGGFLNTPLWGAGTQAAATNAALGNMGGLLGPATPSAVAEAGGFAAGAPTIGGTLGGLAGGFGAGMVAGSITGAIRGTADNTGAMIGAAAGAIIGSIIPGIGTIIGGIIGGAAGGLFGPTKKGLQQRAAAHVDYGVVDGRLAVTGGAAKRIDLAAVQQQTQEQLDKISDAYLSRGLTIDPNFQAKIGFGQGSRINHELEMGQIIASLRSSDATVQNVLDTLSKRGADFNQVMSDVDWTTKVYEPLSKVETAASKFQENFDKVQKTFDDAITKANELGLSEANLTKNRDRQLQNMKDQRDLVGLNRVAQQQNLLTTFIDAIDMQNASPETRLKMAQEAFDKSLSAARKSDVATADLQGLTQAASALLQQGQAYYGTGAGYGDLETFVRSTLANLGKQLELPAFGGDLEKSLSAVVNPLKDEMQLLRDEVERLREELRTSRLRAAA